LQVQLAKTHFQHGVAEFDAGRTDLAIRDLTTALKVLPAAHELRSAVERVIMDRVSIGNKSIPVQSRALSPDGTHSIEFALKEGKIRYHVIDVNTPKAVGIALQDDDGTGQMAFSSDSKRVIKSQSGKIRVWDAATGLLTSQLDVPPSTGAIAFTQYGRRVVTGLWDKSARLWDLQSGTQIGKSMAHDGPVDYVAISSDGLRIVTGSRQDSSARLWDGVTAVAVGEPLRHGGNIHCLNFSHDGSRVVTGGSDNTVRLWDASNGQAVGSPLVHESNVIGVEFSPDDRLLVSAAGKSAHLWNWRNGTRFCDPLIHQDNLWSVTFSPDGMRVATLSTEGSVALWNAQDGKSLGRQLHLGDKSGKIQFHPDGTRIFSNGRSVEAFPIEPVSESIPTEGNVADLKFSPDGKRILAAVKN
jgi:WD40 repeat protein